MLRIQRANNPLLRVREIWGDLDKTHQSGFTLLELLVVVSILAAVSGIGFFALRSDTLNEKYADLAKVEMLAIAKAVKRFKLDTGYYPGTGPFALLDRATVSPYDCTSAVAAGGATPAVVATSRGAVAPMGVMGLSEAGSLADLKLDLWHKSPINMGQLLVAPVLCEDHPLAYLAKWDEATGKGWNGPYLSREGYVDISCILSSNNGFDHGVNGNFDSDPAFVGACKSDGFAAAISLRVLPNIPAIADPFASKNTRVATRGGLLHWRSRPIATTTGIDLENHPELGRIGQPYLLFYTKQFTDSAGNPMVTPHLVPRLVSAGPDGKYGGVDGFNDSTYTASYGNAPNQDAWCTFNHGVAANPPIAPGRLKEASDDIVLCF